MRRVHIMVLCAFSGLFCGCADDGSDVELAKTLVTELRQADMQRAKMAGIRIGSLVRKCFTDQHPADEAKRRALAGVLLPELIEALHRKELKYPVIVTLAEMGEDARSAVPALCAQMAAARVDGTARITIVLEALYRTMKEGDSICNKELLVLMQSVRDEYATILGKVVGRARDVESMEFGLRDGSSADAKRAALLAMEESKDSGSTRVEVAMRLAKYGGSLVQPGAIRALRGIAPGDEKVTTCLLELLTSESGQRHAVTVIQTLGWRFENDASTPMTVLQALLKSVDSGEGGVERAIWAVDSLKMIGIGARAILPDLDARLQRERRERVRSALQEARTAISGAK